MQKRHYSIKEYLELERNAEEAARIRGGGNSRHGGRESGTELHCGQYRPRAGNALKGKPCRVAESNLRVRIARKGRYVYPDALVLCGPPQFDPQDDKRHTILNPRVIIEILSQSTEGYDRGDKFAQYREIDSFEEYILISQDRANVESFLRQPDGAWSMLNFTGVDATARIRSLKVEIPMSEIYAGIEWPAPAASADAGG